MLRLSHTTAGSQVEILFHTDSTVRARGFRLDWRSQPVSPCEEVELEEEEGDIELGHLETGYQLPYNCSLLLSAPGESGLTTGLE